MFYVVAYDIPDDKRRLKLYKGLHAFGLPVQRSVFECSLDEGEREHMVNVVKRHVDEAADKVCIYSLCGECHGKCLVIGQGEIGGEKDTVVI